MATDNFNRTENPLASGWSSMTGFEVMQANGTSALGTTTLDNAAVYTGVSWAVDHFSQGVIGTGSHTRGWGLLVRATTGGAGYILTGNYANGSWDLREAGAGSPQATGTFPSTPTAGDTLYLGVTTSGSNAVLEVKLNGTADTADTGSLTDTTPLSGSGAGPAIYSDANLENTWDSWEGGDLAATTEVGPLFGGLVFSRVRVF